MEVGKFGSELSGRRRLPIRTSRAPESWIRTFSLTQSSDPNFDTNSTCGSRLLRSTERSDPNLEFAQKFGSQVSASPKMNRTAVSTRGARLKVRISSIWVGCHNVSWSPDATFGSRPYLDTMPMCNRHRVAPFFLGSTSLDVSGRVCLPASESPDEHRKAAKQVTDG